MTLQYSVRGWSRNRPFQYDMYLRTHLRSHPTPTEHTTLSYVLQSYISRFDPKRLTVMQAGGVLLNSSRGLKYQRP